MSDLYADIRIHARADGSGTKFLQENVVLAVVEEILSSQNMAPTPVTYLGALMMSLSSESASEAPVYAGMLTLLERAMAQVPRALLVSKAPKMSAALVSVANTHAENAAVLRGALACVLRLLSALPAGPKPSTDSLKLFQWLLTFVVHPSPKVRQRGQLACTSALEQCPGLSDAAARFVKARLNAAALTDAHPALHTLNFLRQSLSAFQPGPRTVAAHAILRLPSVGHPLLSKCASDVVVALCSDADGPALPSAVLAAAVDAMLKPAMGSAAGAPEVDALRAAAAAASALVDVDAAACHTRLAALTTALVRALWRQHVDGHRGNGAGSSGGHDDDGGRLQASEMQALLSACVRPSMGKTASGRLAAALVDALGPRYAPLRDGVLETCASLFTALDAAASPACDQLLKAMASLYADATLGSARPVLLASLGAGAKAYGPEKFVALLPIRVSTDGGEDTSWLLTALRHHIGHATLAFFGSYVVPLTQWLEKRASEMDESKRTIEARNLRNLLEQSWALLPGFCACARDVGESLPAIARLLGSTLAEKPEVRQHLLQGLTLMVQTARSRKAPVVAPDGRGGSVTLELTEDAKAALATVGRFGKNFLPLLFNVHQAEPAEKRPPLQEAVSAVASVTPPATLADLFKAMLRKLLEPAASANADANAGSGSGSGSGSSAPSDPAEAQRGLLDLLIALCPSLDTPHVSMLSRAVRPMLLSRDVLLQKKAYKLIGALCAAHSQWARGEMATLRDAFAEALPACAPGCKGKRLGCLQALSAALPPAELSVLLPALIGEVVLATREVNVKTRAAAFEFLVELAATAERRAPGGTEVAKAEAVRSLVVMIAGGLAGSSAHMIAASLAALGRLTFELRERDGLVETITKLFGTVLALLGHAAHEVVKAVISYCKVALYALPADAVRPLLPRLVPPLLLWCTNKHPHLKTQVRYVMERLVKRFGYEEMAEVTPEAHQRLLTHMRKQKVYAHNKAVERRALRDGQKAGSPPDDEEVEAAARRSRHREYEALVDEGMSDDGADVGGVDGSAHGGSGASGGGGSSVRAKAAAAAAAFASKYGKAEGAAMQAAWKDASDANAGLDLLSAPLVPLHGPGRKAAGAAGGGAGGKRRRGGADDDGGAAAPAASSRAGQGRNGDDDDGGVVRMDPEGKLVVLANGESNQTGGFAGGPAAGGEMEVDPEDEIVRAGGRANKRRRHIENEMAPASKAEEAEAEALAAAKRAARREGRSHDEFNKRKAKSAAAPSTDNFGASFGEQFAGKAGAAGDVIRKGSAGVQPFAYMPLNPRLLGKKQQRRAKDTMEKLVHKTGSGTGSKGVKISKKMHKHGLQARRGRKSSK